ncbi:PilZ domain-containing protein [Shewanella algae]|uniref:PilZ domain-containing protein n=1 Tax=Shewanella algae TaxID=38313 RepID=UPI001AADB691|nr:PilZ domain-containing protein [Shewanella algae]QTE96069.1 PilZ domain-containing protein [Shewanella algae]
MSPDHHSALIEQLKPLMMEPDFSEIFLQLTAEESNSTRFLLKMEIQRLASPCLRIIDLRDKSELPCQEYRFADQRHFLDDPAKEAFDAALALYRNQYTMGVYEQVMEAHRQRRQKLQQTPRNQEGQGNPYLVPGIVLGRYFNRSEERMNYSIKIAVSQPGREEVRGNTADLSVGGARVRLPARHNFDLNRPLRVKLLDLSDEYYYRDLQLGVDYQIVDAQTEQDTCWMRLKRIGGSEQLAEMLASLIRGYKFRYKVDVNDVLVTATGMGFERHYLAHLPHLPLFIEQDSQGKPAIGALLLSRDNQALLHDFLDEADINQLPGLLSKQRLAAMLAEPDNADHRLLFSFTYNARGQLYFYSASLSELKKSRLQPLFLGFGATKGSWKVIQVSLDAIDHRGSYKASMLPGDDSNYSALTEQQLSKYSHILQLMDVTDEQVAEEYRRWPFKMDANELKRFGQAKITTNSIRLVSMYFSERRQEARFSFKTLVNISQGKQQYTGITHDISSRGLQLNLDENATLNPKEPLLLSFPKLQELAPKAKLQALPYRLVRSRKNGVTLHLAAVMGHTPHPGVEFLHRLIEQNREKLQQLTEDNSEVKELAEAMKNLLMRKLHSVPFLVEKTVKSFRLSALGVGVEPDAVSDLFANSSAEQLQFNLEPLLQDGRLKRDFIGPIRAMKPQMTMDSFEVFVQLVRQSSGQLRLRCTARHELAERQAQVDFIRQAQSLGSFMALKVYRGAAGKPDLGYIRRELEYIGVHAKHKAKKLEEMLWRVVGVGEFLEITSEVLLRYPELNPEAQSLTLESSKP